jgi:hypothetical protein
LHAALAVAETCARLQVRDFNGMLLLCAGDMSMAVPYRPPSRPKLLPLSVPFRVFQQYFSKTNDSVSHRELIATLKHYPDAADSLGLLSWIKESNASLQIFQLLFGVEEYNEDKLVTMGDLFRTFSGEEIDDLRVFEPELQIPFTPYVKKKGPERPAFISPSEAVAVFQKIGGIDATSITHGDLIENLKAGAEGKELSKRLGLLKLMRDAEKGSHDLYFLWLVLI